MSHRRVGERARSARAPEPPQRAYTTLHAQTLCAQTDWRVWREAATPEGQRGYSLSPRRCYLQRRCSVNTRCPTQRASVAPSAEVQDGALLAICESLTILISERSRKEISFPSQAPRDGMLAPSEHASIATVTLDDKRREDEQRGKPLRALARSHGLAAAPDGAPKGAPAVTQKLGPGR